MRSVHSVLHAPESLLAMVQSGQHWGVEGGIASGLATSDVQTPIADLIHRDGHRW